MGRIATALPEFMLLWITDPLKAFIITSIGIGLMGLIYGLIWLKLDYPYWKMERELKKRYENKPRSK